MIHPIQVEDRIDPSQDEFVELRLKLPSLLYRVSWLDFIELVMRDVVSTFLSNTRKYWTFLEEFVGIIQQTTLSALGFLICVEFVNLLFDLISSTKRKSSDYILKVFAPFVIGKSVFCVLHPAFLIKIE